MKLRNRKTGKIGNVHMAFSLEKFTVEAVGIDTNSNPVKTWEYYSLAELNEEWEDCEESKKWWYVGADGAVIEANEKYGIDDEWRVNCQIIGNYFKTKEEAERAVEKLKAKNRRSPGFWR